MNYRSRHKRHILRNRRRKATGLQGFSTLYATDVLEDLRRLSASALPSERYLLMLIFPELH